MPYDSVADLPDAVRHALPKHGQEIYMEAFNSAWQQYASESDREERAHKVAWSAVKKVYKKERDRWVPKKTS
jgi:cation transport regulator